MLASDADIKECLDQKLLTVSPTDLKQLLQPASIDLRLDHRFRGYVSPAELPGGPIAAGPVINPAQDQRQLMRDYEVPEGKPFLLPAYGFALGATLEHVAISSGFAGKLEGKSSLGRLGLFIHTTAGWIDPGFEGHITLELFNAAPYPMQLWPGMKIGQLALMALHTPAERPYGSSGLSSHYQGQPAGPQSSQSWRNFQVWPTRLETSHA